MGNTVEICSVNCFDICNLFKIPLPMNDNPFYKVTLEIKKGHSDEDNKEFLKTEVRSLFQKISGQKRSLFTLYEIADVLHWKHLREKLSSYKGTAQFSPWHHRKPFDSKPYDDSIFTGLNKCKKSGKSWNIRMYDQYDKIKKLKNSFDKHGYRPDKFPSIQGGVCGYWLKYENIKKFYVNNGTHRAAVYSALFPDKPLPVVYATKEICKKIRCHNEGGQFLQIYDLKDINNWPSVKEKFLTAPEAREILKKYVIGAEIRAVLA